MNNLKILIEERKATISKITNQGHKQVPHERIKILETWKNYTSYCPPDTFLILHNLKEEEVVHTHGVDKLGFSIKGYADLHQHTHENHKLFYANHILILKQFSLNYKYNNGLLSMRNFNLRALKNSKGIYQYLKVTSKPVSMNKNGYIDEYISWYTPITFFRGQPFKGGLIIDEHTNQKNEIANEYNRQIQKSYDYILFTKRQKEIIAGLKEGANKSKISADLGISVRTVEKYKEMILNKGKILIPYNRFKSANDVVFHLEEMGFI